MTQQWQLPDFSDVHVIVVGDVMIDRYVSGDVTRISPEAPVPVVEYRQTTCLLGGAANVALNVQAMGAQVTLVSVCGNDEEAKLLEEMLAAYPRITARLVRLNDRPTTLKTRIMAQHQHLLRIDTESTSDIDAAAEEQIMTIVGECGKADGIILQDYNKGLLTASLIKNVLGYAKKKNIPTFVDPKEKHFFAYTGCTLFKPNRKEVGSALPGHASDLEEAASIIYEKLNPELLMITLGARGLLLGDGQGFEIVPTAQRVIADVCGAGDTVISVTSLAYIKGLSKDLIARLANLAGGQVCTKPGVVPVDLIRLKQEIDAV